MSKFTDAPTGLMICRHKLQFILDAFSQPHVEDFDFSVDGTSGFFFIIQEIETDLERVGQLSGGER